MKFTALLHHLTVDLLRGSFYALKRQAAPGVAGRIERGPLEGRTSRKATGDNAHIEQKNWTHVRRLMGWERYNTAEAVEAMNDLYRHELRLWMNVFQPSVKLVRKVRVGARLRRVYDAAQSPLARVQASGEGERPRRWRDSRLSRRVWIRSS